MKNTTSNRSRKFCFNSEERFLVLILITVAIGFLIRGYGNWMIEKTTNEVISSAMLVESNDEHYVISFNGEEHYYYFV